MEYVAYLRGINVGGKAIMKMAELKTAVLLSGVYDVETYIQSGNILFRSENADADGIRSDIERILTDRFGYGGRAVIRSLSQMRRTVSEAPHAWKEPNSLRCYVAFVREPVTAREVVGETKPKDGVDAVSFSEGTVYLSTQLTGLTKSGFTRLVGTKIYRDITIRNFRVVTSILTLMEKRNDNG